jgi:plasmid stabilization system protein ParE
MQIQLSENAKTSLASIKNYIKIEKESPQGYLSILSKIRHTLSLLPSSPQMGKLLHLHFSVAEEYKKVRYILSCRYIIVYEIIDRVILIINIYHSHQNYIADFMDE